MGRIIFNKVPEMSVKYFTLQKEQSFDFKKIKEDFDAVIRFSQSIPEPKTDKLFDTWLKAKRRFIDKFNGKLIYEYPEKVVFNLDPKEKHNKVVSFADEVATLWGQPNLREFILEQEFGFFENSTITDYNYKDKMIKKGTRILKAFKYFVNDKKALTDIQNEASRIIQENKVEGTLCFSVHPLDFLSLSENTYNWRSCHSLDGEYRAGNLSYMMDENTFICYLKGADNVKLPNFPEEVKWNSKKWRNLLFLSNDYNMLIAGRPYPYPSKTGIDKVLKVLQETELIFDPSKLNSYHGKEDVFGCFYGIKWTGWNDIVHLKVKLDDIDINYGSFIPTWNNLVKVEDLYKTAKGSKFYNDVLYSTCYNPIYAFTYDKHIWHASREGTPLPDIKETQFKIGGYTYCLWCGEAECLDGSNTMLCDICELEHGIGENEDIAYCDVCGSRMFVDDGYYLNGEYICPHCLETETIECEVCGERMFKDYIRYDEEREMYVCDDCYRYEEEF